MTLADIRTYRLHNQQLIDTPFKKPQDIVSYLCAIQAQEYAVTKWAMSLRLQNATDTIIEKAINDGHILRTHLMRPTWHFVAPADIRWLLKLTAPRVNAFSASMHRKLEMDNKLFKRSNDIIIKELEGGKHLTRTELNVALTKKKIIVDGIRLGLIMMRAELDGIVCSGPRIGKHFTYALLEERVPPAKTITNEEALMELIKRYFTSRGPATIKDFVWWSGLTVKDAKAGIANLGKEFKTEIIEGQEYIFIPRESKIIKAKPITFLMADYDEYGIAYKDRSAIFNSDNKVPKGIAYNRMIIVDNTIAGSWKPVVQNKTIDVETALFRPLNKTQQQALIKAIKKYKDFVTG